MHSVIGLSHSPVSTITAFNSKAFCLGGGGFCAPGSDYIGFSPRELAPLHNPLPSDKFLNTDGQQIYFFVQFSGESYPKYRDESSASVAIELKEYFIKGSAIPV